MVCIHCGAKTHVFNSRLQRRSNRVWRRRQCKNCGSAFTTEEVTHYEAVWAVQSRQGDIQPFSRDRLLLSLYKSCEHRPSALRDAADLTDTVISRLTSLVENGRLWNGSIIQVAQVALSRFDNAAGVHYQAHHR